MSGKVTFRLPYSTKVEGGVHVASCDVLELHSTGFTKQEAHNHLQEEVDLYLETAREMGTLDQVLTSLGFERGDPEEGEPFVSVVERPEPQEEDALSYIMLSLGYLSKGEDGAASG